MKCVNLASLILCIVLSSQLMGCGGGSGGSGNPPNSSNSSNQSNNSGSVPAFGGVITTSAVLLNDGSYANLMAATAGATGNVSVTMNSTQLNPYLLAYTINSNGTLGSKLAETNTSDTGTATTISFAVRQSNVYLIAASTASAGQTGAYTGTVTGSLSFGALSSPSAYSPSPPGSIEAGVVNTGTTITGQLTTGNPVTAAGEYVATYTVNAVTSSVATVTLNAGFPDCVIAVAQVNSDGSLTTIGGNGAGSPGNANGGPSTENLSFGVSEGTQYEIAASSSKAGLTGAFTLNFSSNLQNIQTASRFALRLTPEQLSRMVHHVGK